LHPATAPLAPERAAQVRRERQPVADLGLQWVCAPKHRPQVECGGGRLRLTAAEISTGAPNLSFEATVRVECPVGATAALVFGNGEGLTFDGATVRYARGEPWRTRGTDVVAKTAGAAWRRLRNYRGDLSFASSDDGETWTTFQNGVRADEHTVRLVAAGTGTVAFRQFRYLGLD
jgi:hypothetical protein